MAGISREFDVSQFPKGFADVAATLPKDIRFAHEVSIREGRLTYQWSITGSRGGIHVHGWWSESSFRSDWLGGIEGHSPTRREYDSEEPSHEHCWLLHGPCWHDGSSLQFNEQIAYMLPHDPKQGLSEYVHSGVLSVMLNRYNSWLPTEDQVAAASLPAAAPAGSSSSPASLHSLGTGAAEATGVGE